MRVVNLEPDMTDTNLYRNADFTVDENEADVYKRQEQGYTFAVVLDLSKYFDTLNHEILINLLRKNVKDERRCV